MAEIKTKPTSASVKEFLNGIEDENKRNDAFEILNVMKKATGMEPKMWGPTIVGFGSYHYKYPTGHEGDICQTGFSPRKQNHTLYIMGPLVENSELLKKLGKYKTGKGCLYFKKTADVDTKVLKQLIKDHLKWLKKQQFVSNIKK